MVWHLTWGPHLKAFEARAKYRGGDFPFLREQPALRFGDEEYLNAFYHLNHSRSYSGLGAPQSIPVSEILAYLELLGERSTQERLRYLRVIQRLDVAYLEHMAHKQGKGASTKPR